MGLADRLCDDIGVTLKSSKSGYIIGPPDDRE